MSAAPAAPGAPVAPGADRATFTLDSFVVSESALLGEGKFGRVYRAREKSSRRMCVLKVVEKAAIVAEGVERQFRREVEVHSRLKHPNIIQMYACFQDETHCYLVMELASAGSLYALLQGSPGKRISEDRAAGIVMHVCKALEYLHACNVVHRDIKPENILLHRDEKTGAESVKLADFGWSTPVRTEADRRITLCGTVEYLPPEVEAGETYSFGFDTWTVGVLVFEMLAGYSPFADPTTTPGGAGAITQDGIMAGIRAGTFAFPAAFPPLAADLVRRLLVAEEARIGPTDVLMHPWVTRFCGPYVHQKDTRGVPVDTMAAWGKPGLLSAPLPAGVLPSYPVAAPPRAASATSASASITTTTTSMPSGATGASTTTAGADSAHDENALPVTMATAGGGKRAPVAADPAPSALPLAGGGTRFA